MTPEELAAMQAGLDPRAYYQDPYAAARAGLVDPESLGTRGATPILSGIPGPPEPGLRDQIRSKVSELRQDPRVQKGKVRAQDFLNKYGRGALMATAALPAVGTSLGELQEGRPLGALTALAPAGLSALGAGMIGQTGKAMIGKGGVAGTAFGLGLMGLGAILPGAAASGSEKVKRKLTGEPITGEEDFANQIARARQLDELGMTRYRNMMGINTSSMVDLAKGMSDVEYSDLERKLPLINKLNDAALVRQQALINTQNQAYLQQGMLANAGALARGAQAQTGETVRTALTNNPYASATLNAPQIRFG